MELEEKIISKFKKEFFEKTGRSAKIIVCSRWEGETSFITKNPNMWGIVKAIFNNTGWKWDDITTKRGTTEIIFRKSVIFYILLHNKISFVKIGKITGFDRTSIMNLVKKFEISLQNELYVQMAYSEILKSVKSTYNLLANISTKKSVIGDT